MPQGDTPRDKWAKILLRMKGNIPEVCLQKMKHPQQQTERIYTKASDRLKQKRAENRKGKTQKENERHEQGKGADHGAEKQDIPYRITITEPGTIDETAPAPTQDTRKNQQ